MTEAKIPGGCFLVSRKLMDSGIMNKPPNYLKVWMILLSNAFHTDKGDLKRGQGFTSLPKLMDQLTYYVGYREEKPTKKQVWGIIEWLRNPNEGTTKVPMIVTTKVTHGFVYTIVNYGLYQDMSNYEGNDEGTAKEQRRERQGNNNKKNDKELKKNDKKKTVTKIPLTPLEKTISDFVKHRKQIKSPMTDRAIELMLIKLGKLSTDESEQIEILNQSIEQGWKGIFELKNKPTKTGNKAIDSLPEGLKEFMMEG